MSHSPKVSISTPYSANRAANLPPLAPEISADSDELKKHTVGPAPKRTFTIPRTITIQDDVAASPAAMREKELRRYNSIGGEVDGPSRIVGEFRTLSIHVHDSVQRPSAENSKKEAVRQLADLDWHTISASEVLQRLSVNPKVGLDGDQAKRRLQQNGPNRITPRRKNPIVKYGLYVVGGFGGLLLTASVLCFIAWKPLGEPNPSASNLALAIVLLVVVAVQTGFNAWQDWSTGRVMASIANLLPSDVIVLRDGSQAHIDAKDLVTGDIVFVGLGNKLPADLRFVEVSSDFKIDRAVLTGEAEPIRGTVDSTDVNMLETKNIGLQGTLCVSGSGQGVVVQTGDNTVFGRIAKLSSTGAPAMTTLQREIFRFVIIIITFALAISLFFVILWGAWLNKKHNGFITVPNLIIDVVSVCVAFIPEGLPACVTLSLAIIASTLAKSKVLCKSLMTVETLGSVDVLCSDKTGTLTENRMTVTNAAVLDDGFDVAEARERMKSGGAKAAGVSEIAAVGGICNAAVFAEVASDEPGHLRLANGDATDTAILRFADALRPVAESNADWQEVFKVNFNSKTKFMLKLLGLAPTSSQTLPAPIAAHENFSPDDLMLVVKGAPDVLLKRCAFINDPSGGPALPLNAANQAKLVAVQEAWAAKGQRVLLLAKKVIRRLDVSKELAFDHPDFADHFNLHLNHDLTVVGLVGLVDPPRADIPETVRIMRGAGIRFFMVTGDFALTAVSIAEQCGIITDARRVQHLSDLSRDAELSTIEKYDPEAVDNVRSLVLSGSDLMEMNDSQWELACQYREIVFARTTPEQKLRIVKEFQKRGAIVGMTVDGVNDAPSLKAADVGIAMGGGSDVAMEAADLILLETFSAIIKAVEYGRLVFDNLRKTCLYLLPAGSFSELMPILLNVLFGLPQILSNIQMILICVVTDVLPAISMCLEKPEAGLLTRRPRNTKTDRLVDWRLLVHAYLFLGVLESLCAMSMAFWFLQRKGFAFRQLVLAYGGLPPQYDPTAYAEAINQAQSVYFFTLVGMQWGNLLASRTRKRSIFQQNPLFGPTKNLFILIAMPGSLVFLFFFSYVPFFQRIFLTRGVPVEHIFLPFTFAIGILFLDEARKWSVRKWPKGFLARIAW